MGLSVLFDIGRSWGSIVRAVSRTGRQTAAQEPRLTSPTSSLTPKFSSSTDAATESVRAAGVAFRSAFEKLGAETRPIYTTTLFTGASISATMSGITARVAPLVLGSASLTTTAAVNTQTSTVRTSSSALGLDLSSVASRLDSGVLGLDTASPQSASTIESTAEMNTAPSSYGSSSLTFSIGGQTSGSVGTLSGTYTGTGAAANATSLTFEVTRGDAIGNTPASIGFRVKDQTGTVLFSFTGDVTENQGVYLGADIGLTLSFSAGQLKNNHSASTTVSNQPVTVDANAAFDAGASAPRFDGGAVVTAGSFTVNGTSITVNANDTINSVISRINSSGAGVTASLAGDRITLATNAYSEDAIFLANDTSGFLAATKLSGATTTTGNIRDDEQVFAKTAQFAAVSTGSFTINGISIAVNKDTDSLSSVVDRINGSAAGVTATYDEATDTLELTSASASEDPIVVGGDTSGFLAIAGLDTGNTVLGSIADDVQVLSETLQFGGVVTGAFEINGVSIAVDADADTLQSVLARISASGAGVTASYDAGADRVVITPDVAGATLTIGNDTSGFLAAIDMATGARGVAANPDAAFNATGADGPLFDPGLSVGAGSFTVNGVTIAVAADDTINTVLARITASEASVTATYDEATETVTLTSRLTTGEPIALGNDTSGFLAAVKLDGSANAVIQPRITAFDTTLDQMAEYASVVSGTITVNGQAIAVDPSTTTIEDLVAALDALPDLWAAFDESTGSVTLRTLPGGSATLSDTSGLLAALGIANGTYTGTVGETTALETQAGTVATNSPDVANEVKAAIERVNEALAGVMSGREQDTALRDDLSAAVRDVVESLGDLGVKGLSVTTAGAAPGLTVDRDALEESLDAIAAPVATRIAVDATVKEFAERAALLAASAAERAQTATASEPVRITLPPLPRLDPAVAQSRARRPARTSAYRKDDDALRLRATGQQPGPAGVLSAAPRGAAADQTRSIVPEQPGLFQGLLDDVLKGVLS